MAEKKENKKVSEAKVATKKTTTKKATTKKEKDADKKPRLGKGLDSLFLENVSFDSKEIEETFVEINSDKIIEIDLTEITANPYQPRKSFTEDELDELAESIKVHGVIQPIIVKKALKGYMLIAGERRFRACTKAGLEKIPAIIKDMEEQQVAEVALIENIQRENLTILEEAVAYEKLITNYDLTQKELAQKLGKSRTHITNALRLLKLPFEVRDMLSEKSIEFGHAKLLAGIEDEKVLLYLANETKTKNLSVRALEGLIETYKKEREIFEAEKPSKERDMYIDHLENFLCSKLGTNVKLNANKKYKGKITIDFQNKDDLNRVLEVMQMLEDI